MDKLSKPNRYSWKESGPCWDMDMCARWPMQDPIMYKEFRITRKKIVRALEVNSTLYYGLTDVLSCLIDSKDPRQYFKKLRSRNPILREIYDEEMIMVPVSPVVGYRRRVSAGPVGMMLEAIRWLPPVQLRPLQKWLDDKGKKAIEEAENPDEMFVRLLAWWQARLQDPAYDEESGAEEELSLDLEELRSVYVNRHSLSEDARETDQWYS